MNKFTIHFNDGEIKGIEADYDHSEKGSLFIAFYKKEDNARRDKLVLMAPVSSVKYIDVSDGVPAIDNLTQ